MITQQDLTLHAQNLVIKILNILFNTFNFLASITIRYPYHATAPNGFIDD